MMLGAGSRPTPVIDTITLRDGHHCQLLGRRPVTPCVDGPRLARKICCLAQFELLAVMCPACTAVVAWPLAPMGSAGRASSS